MKAKPSLDLSPGNPERTRSLQDLLAKAQLHARVEALVLAAIPENLRGNLRFISFREGEVVLMVHSAIQASQIRFRQREILFGLRQTGEFPSADKLRVKVSPERHVIRRERPLLAISKENARLLEEEAGHTKDKALREVLEKLARHASS